MNNNDLDSALIGLGLTPREAQLYLTALSSGPCSITHLAKTTKIHRTLVYHSIGKLISEGIFRTTFEGRRKLLYAVEPKDLVKFHQHREEDFLRLMPEIEALSVSNKKRPNIAYYQGREQLQELFRSGIYALDKQIRAYFPSFYMAQLFGKEEMEQIIQERISHGVHTKTLRSRSTEAEFAGSQLTNDALRLTRYLPDNVNLGMAFIVFDYTVNLFSPIEENFGMQIQSESHAKLMTYLFDKIWVISKP